MTMSRFSLEEYNLLSESNIIVNNTEKNICGCIFSKKLKDVVHESFSTKTTNYKNWQNLPTFCCNESFSFNYLNFFEVSFNLFALFLKQFPDISKKFDEVYIQRRIKNMKKLIDQIHASALSFVIEE